MSQFELENNLKEATRMDSSLNTSKAGAGVHKPRKALDNSITALNVSAAGDWITFVRFLYYWC